MRRLADGLAAKTILLDAHLHPYETIYVNSDYHVEFDERGYPVEFTRITAASGK